MYKLLILLILCTQQVSAAYELVPPYHFRYGEEFDWNQKNPMKKEEVPYFLKPPSNLSAGDSSTTLANKYAMTQLDHLVQSMREDALKMAKEAGPGIAKSVDKVANAVANTNVKASTFNVTHTLKYDAPSGIALYTAEASSVSFTAKHETFSNADMMSLAYKLNKEENVGVRYLDVTNALTVFIEGSW